MPAVGDPVLAADLLAARLTSDVTLATSSTTLQNVTGLSVSVPASRIYIVECMFLATNAAGTTEDIKYGFTFPSGATLLGGIIGGGAASVSGSTATDMTLFATDVASGSSSFPVGISNTNRTMAIWRGTLTMSSTAGTFQVQAAQNTSGANASSVRAGSHIILTRVG